MLVTVPLPEPMTEADFFWRALRERDLPFGGVVVNKVHPSYVGGGRSRLRARASTALREAGVPEATAGPGGRATCSISSCWPTATARTSSRLEQRLGADAVIEVPLLEHDVHDLEGLAAISRHLFAGN